MFNLMLEKKISPSFRSLKAHLQHGYMMGNTHWAIYINLHMEKGIYS